MLMKRQRSVWEAHCEPFVGVGMRGTMFSVFVSARVSRRLSWSLEKSSYIDRVGTDIKEI